jgi:hypothetical protein
MLWKGMKMMRAVEDAMRERNERAWKGDLYPTF